MTHDKKHFLEKLQKAFPKISESEADDMVEHAAEFLTRFVDLVENYLSDPKTRDELKFVAVSRALVTGVELLEEAIHNKGKSFGGVH